MKLAIMQPYFLPYIGYFQLMAAVDVFVVYDNIKYTKKGWINRNRMLVNGKDVMFSLPLKGDSDSLCVCDRELAKDFNREKLLSQFRGTYQRAPHFAQAFPVLEQIVRYEESNLFRFLHHSILRVCDYLGVETNIRISSDIAMDHNLKNQERVIAMCKATGASTYINAIGGVALYAKEAFQEQKVDLRFVRSKPFEYPQFGDSFVPWLSIIDVMMFNPLDAIQSAMLTNYELI